MTENEAKRPKVAKVGGGRNVEKIFAEQMSLLEQMALLEELESYRAIGTVEECKALKEKNKPKKPVDKIMYLECPNCGDVGILDCGYCPACGQAIDWQ